MKSTCQYVKKSVETTNMQGDRLTISGFWSQIEPPPQMAKARDQMMPTAANVRATDQIDWCQQRQNA
jgi:hypothetical protein